MTFSDYVVSLLDVYKENGKKLSLGKGTTATAITGAERKLGFNLHPDLRTAWLVADGAKDGQSVFANPGFLTAYGFLSLAGALKERSVMKSRSTGYKNYVEPYPRSPKIRAGWFQDGWLPFASFSGGTLLLIQDYSPSDCGQIGQVISFTHDPDHIAYVAPSFSEFLGASLKSAQSQPYDFLLTA